MFYLLFIETICYILLGYHNVLCVCVCIYQKEVIIQDEGVIL